METPDLPDAARLTLLERAQLLHDATLRRHGEMLDSHEDSRLRHEARMEHLETLIARQQHLQRELQDIANRLTQQQAEQAARLDRHEASLAWHEEIMASLAQTLAAIKEMLGREN